MNKQFIIKIYDRNNNFIKTLTNIGEIIFSKVINGGVGELVIVLPEPIDAFGEGTDYDYMYKVEIMVSDNEVPGGLIIYSGYIDTFEPQQTAAQEFVNLRILGYGTHLSKVLHRDSNDITIDYSSQAADVIFKDIIDKYRAIQTNTPIDYTGSSVETGGNNITDSYYSLTSAEALERLRQRAGFDWFWYIGGDNVAQFRERPTSATHTFIYGKDIVPPFRYTKSIRDVTNRVLFWDQNVASYYFYNDTYLTEYWHRISKKVDSNIDTQAKADQWATAFIENNQNINTQIRFTVLDNSLTGQGYDVESIEPGDTCKILNISDQQLFGENMFITSVEYHIGFVQLYVEDTRKATSRSLDFIEKDLQQERLSAGQPNYSAIDVS